MKILNFYSIAYRHSFIAFLAINLTLMSGVAFAQTQETLPSTSKLKQLSLEELMNIEIEVTSVSRRPEKLMEVASAIQVVTGEDIHRSGVTRLPEALRLASNLQVAQANSNSWSITARGFAGLPSAGGILANKLLVMVDGRSIYNPLFGGVYWDVQNVLMQDLDHIEVVSGPGGTLWGANAVNGIVNIVSKSARETQGLYLSAAAGLFLQDMGEARYGFRLDSNLFVRVYGQRFDQRNTYRSNGSNMRDAWNMTQGGFRMDYYPSEKNTLTLQGDIYGGTLNDSVLKANTDGQNILARWSHIFSEESDMKIQIYYDRTWRKTPNSVNAFFYQLNTYDLDMQHRFSVGKKQSIIWGLGYQLRHDKIARGLDPLSRNMPRYTAFVQDEITIMPERLKLTLGSKFLHNIYTGFEIQPGIRLGWMPNKYHTLWTAVSRAVRLPTRFDSDIANIPGEFDSEKVIAYELGYRIKPVEKIFFSLAAFYNQYTDVRSIDSNTITATPALIIGNSQRAESWGLEFSGNYQVKEWWRLRGGYTFFKKNMSAITDKVVPLSGDFEGIDPANQFMLQSIMDLYKGLQLDMFAHYTDVIRSSEITSRVPAYFTFDLRLAYRIKAFEVSLIGQNLLESSHVETGSSKIPRSIYGKVTCQF
jgi:iron complex outermembrane recepter protein